MTATDPNQVQRAVERDLRDLDDLAIHLRDWFLSHQTAPRRVTLSKEQDGGDEEEFWLITDHTGTENSSYRIVFDDELGAFGISSQMASGVDYLLGIYGSLSETIESL